MLDTPPGTPPNVAVLDTPPGTPPNVAVPAISRDLA
jgi:hypothetical protein